MALIFGRKGTTYPEAKRYLHALEVNMPHLHSIEETINVTSQRSSSQTGQSLFPGLTDRDHLTEPDPALIQGLAEPASWLASFVMNASRRPDSCMDFAASHAAVPTYDCLHDSNADILCNPAADEGICS